MTITNVSGTARYLPALGVVIDADETFEADDDLALSLLEQPDNWAEED